MQSLNNWNRCGPKDEGFFSYLVADLSRLIFAFIEDDKSYASAMRVNKRWKQEIINHWYEFAEKKEVL